MKQEDKELLLKDLCARLPYVVIVQYKGHNTIIKNKLLTGSDLDCNMEYYKPYLRLLSNMTEEEKAELLQLMGNGTDIQRIDFYLSHHFDFMGLIPRGLAIEVTNENNPYETLKV